MAGNQAVKPGRLTSGLRSRVKELLQQLKVLIWPGDICSFDGWSVLRLLAWQIGPASFIHVMNGVEQKQLLHVGVF